MRRRDALGMGRIGMSLTREPTGLFVNLVKVLLDETGKGVTKSCGWLFGFNPVASWPAAGKLPSLLKFKADANTREPGVVPA